MVSDFDSIFFKSGVYIAFRLFFFPKFCYIVSVLKGGLPKKGLEICIARQLFDALEKIMGDVDASSDPDLLSALGSMLMRRGDYEKACKLFLRIGHVQKALDMCIHHDITITEVLQSVLITQIF